MTPPRTATKLPAGTSPSAAPRLDELPGYHAELAEGAAPTTDRSTVQLVVIVLGLVAIAGISLVGVLAYQAKAIPDALIGLSSLALGAVAGLLSKTSS